MNNTVLLPSTYLPTEAYFFAIKNHDHYLIEGCEHFVKQTLRNRMMILTASGPFPLTIPVKKMANHTPMKEVKIDDSVPWQRNHWRTMVAAYNNSPYFLYYQDFFAPFYEKKYSFLIDFNTELLAVLLKLMKMDTCISITDVYQEKDSGLVDCKNLANPKLLGDYIQQAYPQVFALDQSFYSNLSIIDKLFNVGHTELI